MGVATSPTDGDAGLVSVQVYAYGKRAQLQDRQLVVVEPKALYDMETGAELVIARGAQWWYPGTPLQCKAVSCSKVLLILKQGGVVAGFTPSTRATGSA